MFHKQDQVLQLAGPSVHKVSAQLCKAGRVLASLAATVQEAGVDPGVGPGA